MTNQMSVNNTNKSNNDKNCQIFFSDLIKSIKTRDDIVGKLNMSFDRTDTVSKCFNFFECKEINSLQKYIWDYDVYSIEVKTFVPHYNKYYLIQNNNGNIKIDFMKH